MVMAMSCSTLNQDMIRVGPVHDGIDPELMPYVVAFLGSDPELSDVWMQYDLTVGFYHFSRKGVAGACYYFRPGVREISINPVTWESSSSSEKWALMYHELVHCLCNRSHTHPLGKYGTSEEEDEVEERNIRTGYFDDGCATSIMHPRMQSRWCTEKHQDYYLGEMLRRCRP